MEIDRRQFLCGAAGLSATLGGVVPVWAGERAEAAGFKYSELHRFKKLDGPGGVKATFCLASDGAFYGISGYGGGQRAGCIFRMAPDGKITVLHDFSYTLPLHYRQEAGLIQGTSGKLYGTRQGDGVGHPGTAFSFDPASGRVKVLHTFDGLATGPLAPLFEATDGHFYGTTVDGGNAGMGSVYRLSPKGEFKEIHHFKGGSRAKYPQGGVIEGVDGLLYGTTCGEDWLDWGSVFCIDKRGELASLHTLEGAGEVGRNPPASLTRLSDGSIYGVTTYGTGTGGGAVFRIGTKNHLIPVFYFSQNVGYAPQNSLIEGRDGLLYLALSNGGKGLRGSVVALNRDGAFRVIHDFRRKSGGQDPYGGLVQDADGRLIGTTNGARSPPAWGLAYALTPV